MTTSPSELATPVPEPPPPPIPRAAPGYGVPRPGNPKALGSRIEALVLRHRGWSGIVVLLLFAVSAYSIVWILDKAGGGSHRVPAADLRIGDCFDVGSEVPAAPSGLVGTTLVVECQRPHYHEVFYVGSLDDVPGAPDSSTIENWARARCAPAFESYVGASVSRSSLSFAVYFPSDVSWFAGDRTAQCILEDPRLEPLAGSMKGSKR